MNLEFDGLESAARHAIAYRREVALEDCTRTLGYAEMLAAFKEPTPEGGRPAAAVINELAAKARPGLRSKTGSRFFGWVIGGSNPAGVGADWLTSAWGQNCGNQFAAPAAAAAEAVACAWLLDILDLPRDSGVGLATGATLANFVCLAAARNEVLRRAGWDVEQDGLFGAPPIEVVLGDDAHVAVFVALRYLGLGEARVHRVACDNQGRMRAAELERALKDKQGPVIAIAQAGQINTGAFDPFTAIVPAARDCGAWLHIDGAFGLWARACPPRRHLTEGLELADSWATDGHKWLQTPYDCGFAIVRDADAQRRAMNVTASYLPPAEGAERDPSQYVPELSRRARGFATWAMIKHLGRGGIAEMVERHCRVAAAIGERLAREPGISVENEVCLNQISVRFGDGEAGDKLTLAVVERIQKDGIIFAGAGRWRDRWVIRISVSGEGTTDADVPTICDAVVRAWREVS